ncbi:MAG: hypothetical protein CM15mP93_16830 [Thiotrichaceae bacterium]|nr:MAG: hypothetical protein CM15mP93_16830 [Thiotrichaceae bacterium]
MTQWFSLYVFILILILYQNSTISSFPEKILIIIVPIIFIEIKYLILLSMRNQEKTYFVSRYIEAPAIKILINDLILIIFDNISIN